MAPSNLQGLNIVQPAPPQNSYLSDQDLLSVPPFPDLTAQLDLWTNLNFQSDEPLVSRKDLEKRSGSIAASDDDSERYNLGDDDLSSTGKVAEAHAHENVVTGTVVPPNSVSSAGNSGLPQLPPFDIGSLLAGFGIDPFHIPSLPSHPLPAANNTTPSLAQLLSYHSLAGGIPSLSIPGAPPAPAPTPVPATPVHSQTLSTPAPAPAKRARTSRASISMDQPSPEAASPASLDDEKLSGNPLNASEDKRRRNTAASARFRLKKKEREAALEKKAKELEVRVSELEKECEALRRENGWLKGLVVGVTGAGAVQASATAGTKRTRDEAEEKAQS
ncbi:bZIP transcription factor [Phanerochaete sordida]|uniref:BZIP transcription factor n=1 Tax=Phanerochaete sordida TaxID=48140 RepID=A0A9P3GBL1_9APHY|nr:bZIP transcription factor [Phanerochaete sordida]